MNYPQSVSLVVLDYVEKSGKRPRETKQPLGMEQVLDMQGGREDWDVFS